MRLLSRSPYLARLWIWEMLLGLLFVLCLEPAAASSSCPQKCGDISIPFPFGLAPGCGLPQFQLNCTETSVDWPSKPFNGTGKQGPHFPYLSTPGGPFQVLSITAATIVVNVTDLKAVSCDGPYEAHGSATFTLEQGSPYVLSAENKFFVNGCNSSGNVTTDVSSGAACVTSCNNVNGPANYPFCNIYDCCVSSLPEGSRWVVMHGGGIPFKGGGCGFASMVYPPSFIATDKFTIETGQYGVELKYALNGSCHDTETVATTCSGNATCQDVDHVPGYLCVCEAGFVGDGYTAGSGCLELNECKDSASNACAADADCIDTPGGYDCSCVSGYHGDGFRNGTSCTLESSGGKGLFVAAATVVSLGTLSLLGLLACWYLKMRRRKSNGKDGAALTNSAKYYSSNLKSLTSHREMLQRTQGMEGAHLLTLKELEEATEGFSDEKKLGTGGCGTVYKGTLQQGTVVAIKRTNAVGVDNIDQFYNEVTVLSQVNHRNLVRLLGCCLETEVPMLVYEYVANGTLYEYLHEERESREALDWDNRLRIGMETAEALVYLHSAANPPIYHRDMKTANILLDEHLTAKVADFGLSKLVPHDVTHVSTMVKGTPGYLDPEYYQNYQVTDKSDVYGFGVILLELITGQKPVDFSRDPKNVNLAAMALSCHRKGRLQEIIHPSLVGVDSSSAQKLETITKVADLAVTCLAFQRVDRPTMKEVLEVLTDIKGEAWKRRNAGQERQGNPVRSPVPPSFHRLFDFNSVDMEASMKSTTHKHTSPQRSSETGWPPISPPQNSWTQSRLLR